MRINEIAHITALERQAHAAARCAGKVLRKCGDDRFLIVCPRLNRVTPRDGTGQTKCPATGETTDRGASSSARIATVAVEEILCRRRYDGRWKTAAACRNGVTRVRRPVGAPGRREAAGGHRSPISSWNAARPSLVSESCPPGPRFLARYRSKHSRGELPGVDREIDSILKTFKQDDSNNEVAASGCGEQIDDILDGLVGAVICGFESAVWAMLGVWSVMKAAVGKWSAQPFVEEQK
jgi:hypothetical protein